MNRDPHRPILAQEFDKLASRVSRLEGDVLSTAAVEALQLEVKRLRDYFEALQDSLDREIS